jgi:hypothetical protein
MTNRERAIEEVAQVLIYLEVAQVISYLEDKIEAQSARILELIDQLNQARERIAEMGARHEA